jgi:hypothetical protein
MTDSADYDQLPDADRDNARSAARTEAVQAAEHYARLLAVEAAIAARAEFPDLSRLVFRLGETDVFGPSVTLVAAYDADGRQLWHEDEGQEWPDDSLVADRLTAAAEWAHGDYFPFSLAEQGEDLFLLNLAALACP